MINRHLARHFIRNLSTILLIRLLIRATFANTPPPFIEIYRPYLRKLPPKHETQQRRKNNRRTNTMNVVSENSRSSAKG
jgi:hypothetical protein